MPKLWNNCSSCHGKSLIFEVDKKGSPRLGGTVLFFGTIVAQLWRDFKVGYEDGRLQRFEICDTVKAPENLSFRGQSRWKSGVGTARRSL